MNDISERLYRREEAAAYIAETFGFPCSPKTLAKLASIGIGGPAFVKCGHFPMYPKSSLNEWARSKMSPLVRSNAELASHAEPVAA